MKTAIHVSCFLIPARDMDTFKTTSPTLETELEEKLACILSLSDPLSMPNIDLCEQLNLLFPNGKLNLAGSNRILKLGRGFIGYSTTSL
jgi:hypothetical protein